MSMSHEVTFTNWWRIVIFYPVCQDSEIVSDPIHQEEWEPKHSMAWMRLAIEYPHTVMYAERISEKEARKMGLKI